MIEPEGSSFPIPEPAPRPRFGLRLGTMLGLIALIAAGYGSWRAYRSPERAWRRAIHSPDKATRKAHWSRLQREHEVDGLDREGTVREVLASMNDPDPETRLWSVSSVGSIEADPLVAIPRVAERLGDGDLSVRVKAASVLGELVKHGGPGRDEAVFALSKALKDPEPIVRRAAVGSIGQVVYEGGPGGDPLRSGRPDDPALDLVAARLGDDDLAVKVEAARVLASNDRGGEAVPMLIAYLREQPKPAPLGYLADRAMLALMVLAIHSDEAAAFLASELAVDREGYPDRPRDALTWAARQTPEARARVRRLAGEALKSREPAVRHNAALLMHDIGSGKAALPELIAALGDPSVDTRIRAVEALADLGDIDPTIVPALELAAADKNVEVRERARGALEEFEFEEMLETLEGVPR
jgi:HEAT repeat protein